MLGTPRIDDRVRRVDREFGGVGLAGDDTAVAPDITDAPGVVAGLVTLPDRRTHLRRQDLGVHDVLDSHRHARQDALVSAAVYRLRLTAPVVEVQVRDGLEPRIE